MLRKLVALLSLVVLLAVAAFAASVAPARAASPGACNMLNSAPNGLAGMDGSQGARTWSPSSLRPLGSAVRRSQRNTIANPRARTHRRSGARICDVALDCGNVAGQKNQSTHGPAKVAASGLTKHLAVECLTGTSASTPSRPGRSDGSGAAPAGGAGRHRIHRGHRAHAPHGATRRAARGRAGDSVPRLGRGVVHHGRHPPGRRRLPGPVTRRSATSPPRSTIARPHSPDPTGGSS
jgi:hypothetical protein